MAQISTCIPPEIKTIQSPCDYATYWQELEEKGKDHYGSNFHLRSEDAAVWIKLLAWMKADEAVAADYKIALHKGIMLCGPVGVGKTSMMQLLKAVVKPEEPYKIYSCREIAFEFSRKGFEVVQHYGHGSYYGYPYTPEACCFDDLGLEMIMQHYGVPCNVMGEILLNRYDHFINHGMLTHITTNLTSDELAARYGARILSRMRQMLNLVAFDRGTADKRM